MGIDTFDMFDTLFTLGDWEIRNDQGMVPWATHTSKKRCPISAKNTMAYSWIIGDTSTTCHYCGVTVPDEIQGLVLLHNYDRVVKGT